MRKNKVYIDSQVFFVPFLYLQPLLSYSPLLMAQQDTTPTEKPAQKKQHHHRRNKKPQQQHQDSKDNKSDTATAAPPRQRRHRHHHHHAKKKDPEPPATPNAPASESNDNDKDKDSDTSSEASGELCFICTEPIVTYAVGACDHRTCHLCALRLRALYETRNCAYCKVCDVMCVCGGVLYIYLQEG